MAILFSCIGNTDPIKNYHDGPMLHILRHYEDINLCYLFLTAEMEKKDSVHFYDKPIAHLKEQSGRDIKVVKIPTGIVMANDFDLFYNVFEEKIGEIIKDYPEEKIYVNVTSSTPQMISTLAVIISQNKFKNLYAIQVDYYRQAESSESKKQDDKKINETKKQDDIDYLIETNLDNLDSKKRAREVKFLETKRKLDQEQIKSLIESYDYYSIIESRPKSYLLAGKLGCLIRHMKHRMNLDFKKAIEELEKLNIISQYLPYYKNEEKNTILEYYFVLKCLLKKPALNDFIIRLPILTIELQKKIIYKYFNEDVEKSLCYKGKNRIDSKKLSKDFKIYLENKYFIPSDVTLPFLNYFIEYYNTSKIINEIIIKTFRNVEKIVNERNIAAHKMGIIKKEDFKSQQINIDIIVSGLKIVIKDIYKDVDDEYFKIYDKVNEEIQSLL